MSGKRIFPDFLKISALPCRKPLPKNVNVTACTLDTRFITFLKEALDFEYSLLFPPDGQFGHSLPDGNWTGMIGMVHREEADVAINKIAISAERMEIIDYSYPYHYSPQTFITDKPHYLRDSFGIVYPFSLVAWCTIAASLIILLLVSFLFKSKRFTSRDMLLTLYGILLNQSSTLELEKLSIRCLIASWLIGTTFITFCYKAVLLSFLTFPNLVGIRDISELAEATEKDSFKCSTYPGSYLVHTLLKSSDRRLEKIGECLIRSEAYTLDIEKFLSDYKGKKTYVGSKFDLNPLNRNYFVSQDSFFAIMTGIVIRKSFCCKDALDTVINTMAKTGILQKIERDDNFFTALGFGENDLETEESPYTALSLGDISGAFFFLAAGHVAAIATFVVEVVSGKKKHHFKN